MTMSHEETEGCINYKVSNFQHLSFKLQLHYKKLQLADFDSIFHLKFMNLVTELCQAPELWGGSSRSSAITITRLKDRNCTSQKSY